MRKLIFHQKNVICEQNHNEVDKIIEFPGKHEGRMGRSGEVRVVALKNKNTAVYYFPPPNDEAENKGISWCNKFPCQGVVFGYKSCE